MRSPSRRRLLVALLASWAATCPAALTQPRPKRVVHLMNSGPVTDSELAEVRRYRRAAWARQGMREGRDYYETLVAGGGTEAEEEPLAREVVAGRPDLIMANAGSTARIFQRLTTEIPVVFYGVSDALLWGLVRSYRRPGGNLTGVSTSTIEASIKRIEIIKELRPAARRIAWLSGASRTRPGVVDALRDGIAAGAGRMGLELVEVAVPAEPSVDMDRLARTVRDARVDGLVAYSVPVEVVTALAERSRLLVVGGPAAARRGAVAGFGFVEDTFELALRIATRVLRGESPADIPVEQPSRWRLEVNVAAARELGFEVPASLLARADEIVR